MHVVTFPDHAFRYGEGDGHHHYVYDRSPHCPGRRHWEVHIDDACGFVWAVQRRAPDATDDSEFESITPPLAMIHGLVSLVRLWGKA